MHRSPHYVSAFALVLGFSFVAGCGQKKIASYSSSDGNTKVTVYEPHGCDFARQITFRVHSDTVEYGPKELDILECGVAFSEQSYSVQEPKGWIVFCEKQVAGEKAEIHFAHQLETSKCFDEESGFPKSLVEAVDDGMSKHIEK